jgi:protein-tyrosine phosphatase
MNDSAFFVDCHSHVCPSGDDGAATVRDAAALTREAARHGTAVLFATPHVWPHLPLAAAREAEIRRAFAELRPLAGLELRLGFELTPDSRLLDEDPHRYLLEGTDCVLMEVPFGGPIGILVALAEHVEAAGLRPVIAHPERTEPVLARPQVAYELAERGWALQVNGSSLLGRHGADAAELGWRFVEEGIARLVASDGHRPTRPPHLDEAWSAVVERVGDAQARPLFDGSALGVEPVRRRETA